MASKKLHPCRNEVPKAFFGTAPRFKTRSWKAWIAIGRVESP